MLVELVVADLGMAVLDMVDLDIVDQADLLDIECSAILDLGTVDLGSDYSGLAKSVGLAGVGPMILRNRD